MNSSADSEADSLGASGSWINGSPNRSGLGDRLTQAREGGEGRPWRPPWCLMLPGVGMANTSACP